MRLILLLRSIYPSEHFLFCFFKLHFLLLMWSNIYLTLYTTICLASLFMYAAAFLFYLYGTMRASRIINNKLMDSVFGSTLRCVSFLYRQRFHYLGYSIIGGLTRRQQDALLRVVRRIFGPSTVPFRKCSFCYWNYQVDW